MPRATLQSTTPARELFLRDVVQGLGAQPKTLPSKYFYDERGSRLFNAICRLDEYYLTRTELAIMRQHAAEIAERVGRQCVLIEYGSGSSTKTRVLLDRLQPHVTYVPVDIAGAHLRATAAHLSKAYPAIDVRPICADFTQPFELPSALRSAGRHVVYFPGSTIGNFEPETAVRLLARIGQLAGRNGGLLIGFDLRKERQVVEAAYNDGRGVTARFNLNLLRRINRELDGDFDLSLFGHRAFFNARESRIEMHLVSRIDQTVQVQEHAFRFRQSETIHTENSYKHTLDGFRRLADAAGLVVDSLWCDADRLFSVQYLVPRT